MQRCGPLLSNILPEVGNAFENPILTEIVRRLVASFQPERIYLFGSTARGDADYDSDYDIVVIVRE